MKPYTSHRLISLLLLLILVGAAAIFHFDRLPSTCPLYNLTGLPCPLCKMTSSWSLVLHGNFLAGLTTNPMGVFFLLLSFIGIGYILFLLIRRKPVKPAAPWWRQHPRLTGIFLTAWLINWLWVIYNHHDW